MSKTEKTEMCVQSDDEARQDQSWAAALKRAAAGERIGDEECLALLRCPDLIALGRAAHAARCARTDPAVVTYNADHNINYTNVCASRCAFCAFHRRPGASGGYVLGEDDFRAKIRTLYESGGSQILLQGGLNPDLPLEWAESLLRWLRAEWPGLHLHCFSPPEIVHWARVANLSIRDTVERLRDAGLQTIPGGGAEILAARPRRKLSPGKASAGEWIEVMRQAASLGLRGTATTMSGLIETPMEHVEHLRRLRDLQDETGVFTAFIGWTFQAKNARLQESRCAAAGYLRAAAVARLYLDNIPNHQASWVTQGPKIGQISLFFGINDLGSTMMEENVVREAGTQFRLDAAELESLASEAGFRPVRRDYYYRPYVHPTDPPVGLQQNQWPFP